MPVKPSEAKLWYYEDFLTVTQNKDILSGQPKDWSRLRVWDGQNLKPAIADEFQGTPTDDQIEQLYEDMKQGRLYIFELGDKNPRRMDFSDRIVVDLNPIPPVPLEEHKLPAIPKPEVPNPRDLEKEQLQQMTQEQYDADLEQWKIYERDVNRQNALKRQYEREKMIHQYDMDRYRENLDTLTALGDEFRNAADSFNNSRDLTQEAREREVREKNAELIVEQRNLNKADYVINNMMGTQPQAVPEVYFSPNREAPKDKRATKSDATFEYDLFNKSIEPNGYKLPTHMFNEGLLDEYDAATINFAMVGAMGHMTRFAQEKMQAGGPLGAQVAATQGFNMMVTGMFGQIRKKQYAGEMFGEAMRLGKEVITNYYLNDVKPLAKNLADCVRNIKINFSSIGQRDLNQDSVAASKLSERLLKLFAKKPEILAATDLQQKDLEFLKGYAELGKVYDNYLNAHIRLNDAEKPMTVEEKAGLLADVVIRRMLEKEMIEDSTKVTSSEAYRKEMEANDRKDADLMKDFEAWKRERGIKPEDSNANRLAVEEYQKKHDLGVNGMLLGNYPVEHRTMDMLSKPGMLDRLRQSLQKDPAILALAQQQNPELTGKALHHGDQLDQLVQNLRPAMLDSVYVDAQKRNWFASLKNMLTQEHQDPTSISPWPNPQVESDAGRLMIALDNGDNTKSLVSVSSLLEKGMDGLQNPGKKDLDLLYRNAMEGNLYYYEVGKDMPVRLNAEAENASVEKLTVPAKPNWIQRLLHTITFGWAFSEMFDQQPDRDPQAVTAFQNAKQARAGVARTEAAQRRQVAPLENELLAPEPEKSPEEIAREAVVKDITDFNRLPEKGTAITYPQYTLEQLTKKMIDTVNALATGEFVDGRGITIVNNMVNAIRSPKTTPDQVRELMASAVVLEAVRQEHYLNNGSAGPLEEAFMTQEKGMVNSMLKDPTFKAFTQNASVEMLQHFFMTDGARNMNEVISNVAKQNQIQKDASKPEKQLDNQLENQPKPPEAGLS